MQKLRLNLDQLTVDSFDTSATAEKKGTVFGEQCTCYTVCTCPGCPTCDMPVPTCGGSCPPAATCDASCYFTDCNCETIDGGPTCDPTYNKPGNCCV